MKQVFDSHLEAKVDARNRLNAKLNELHPILLARFRPLVGQKIMKVGGFMEKFKHLPPPTLDGDFHITRYPSDYTLSFTVRTDSLYRSTYGGDHCCACYQEDTITIGEFLDNQGFVLKTVLDDANLHVRRTDYTADWVRDKRRNVKLADAALSAAKSALGPFEEYDR